MFTQLTETTLRPQTLTLPSPKSDATTDARAPENDSTAILLKASASKDVRLISAAREADRNAGPGRGLSTERGTTQGR